MYCSLSTTSQPSIYFSRITMVMVGPSQYNTRGKDSWSLSLHSGSHQQTAYESLPNYSCRNVLQTTLFSVRHLLFSFLSMVLGPKPRATYSSWSFSLWFHFSWCVALQLWLCLFVITFEQIIYNFCITSTYKIVELVFSIRSYWRL